MARRYSPKELRLLYSQSGDVCAFPGCGQKLTQPESEADDGVNMSDIAHIVGDSRQGPRGRVKMGEADRNKHTNLVLLCPTHHRLVDDQPRTYSIPVLLQMKADHLARVAKLRESLGDVRPSLIDELLHSTLLPITHVPGVVFSAPCKYADDPRRVIANLDDGRFDRHEIFPFILRNGRLFTFHDIRLPVNAFNRSVNHLQADEMPSDEFWSTIEGERWFVELLNRSLSKYLGRSRVYYDKRHKRHYFPTVATGKERTISYRPLNARNTTRKAVWQPKSKKTGEGRDFWWHLAAGLRFEHVAARQWVLTIRPERHLTRDGETPLDPDWVGRRVTRLKARMYNDKYLAEVQFWRDFLCNGRPNLIMNFGGQTLVCESALVCAKIHWPGVAEDEKPFKNQRSEGDLFAMADLQAAIDGYAHEEYDAPEDDA